MIWVPWPKSDQRGLARYVASDAVALFAPGVNRHDLREQADGRLQIVRALYSRLLEHDISYAWEKFAWERSVQLIRTAREVLDAPREGTCLDLAVLFAGLCLGCELLPMIVVLDGHAFVAVSLIHDLRDYDARERRPPLALDNGLLLNPAALRDLVDRGGYVAVECTGFARTLTLPQSAIEATGRAENEGLLTFEQACAAGRAQLDRKEQGSRFGAEIATLHQIGYRPLSEQVIALTADFADALIGETSGRTRRLFNEAARHSAIEEALTAGLAAAAQHLPPAADPQTYTEAIQRLSDFARRDAVHEELAQLLDPQDSRQPDLERLYTEFVDVGFAVDYCSRATFEQLIRAFVAAFYNAASQQAALQGVLQIQLLHTLAERMGAHLTLTAQVSIATERTASAAEQVVKNTSSLVVEMARGQHDLQEGLATITQALHDLPGRQFDLFQLIAAGLGRADIVVDINAQRQILMHPLTTSTEKPTIPLEGFRDLLRSLLQEIDRNSTDPAQIALLRERYLALIVDQFQYLRLEGLTTDVKPINLPLEQVYVHLRAVAQVPESADAFSPEERRILRLLEEAEQQRDGKLDKELNEAYLQLDALRRERWMHERLERFPISQALADARQRALVILGDPGSGKTTLLQFLALSFARGPARVNECLKLNGQDADRLPIFAPLASYDEMLKERGDLTIAEFLAHYYERRRAALGLGSVFTGALESGQALILLDGLDEVSDEGRRKFVAEQVEAFIRSTTLLGNRVVLTSRIYGYRAAPLKGDLPHITVLDFRREEIEVFARQWFRALAAWEYGKDLTPQQELLAQQKERQLLADIISNPGVERLAVNPLLLTMLALLRRQVGSLPQRRIKLYDVYVTALIQTWEENRSRGARQQADERIDLKEAEGALITLALWMQQHRLSGTATQDDLIGQLVAFYLWEDEGIKSGTPDIPPPAYKRAEKRAQRFMHDMRQYSGLLIERGYNAFGFRHLTFQEYFAGRALARMAAGERWDLLKANLHSNRWREPILLAAARLGVSDNRDQEASDLVEGILDARSDFDPALHRDLFLAADCAADDIGVTLPLLRRITGQLQALLDSSVPLVAQAAMQRLYQLTLLRAGSQSRLPEALRTLAQALPIESVFSRYSAPSPVKRELVQQLLVEHPDVRQQVLDRLADDNWNVRRAAVEALASLLPTHPDLRPLVLARLADDDNDVRSAAVQALASLLPDHPELRQPVLDRLADDDNDVRSAAIQALTSLLPDHPDLRPLMLARLADDDNDVRSAAVEALASLLPNHPDLRPLVLARLADDDQYMRSAAVEALASLLPNHPDLRPLVLDRLADDDNDVRSAAVQALASLLPDHPDLRPLMLDRLADDDQYVRRAAVQALASLLPDHPDLRPHLLARLADDDNDVRRAAVQALASLLPNHPDLRPLVLARLADPASNVRRTAINVLSGLLNEDESITTAIQQMLHHNDWRTRRDTILILAESLRNNSIRPELISQTWDNESCDESSSARSVAVQALASLLPDHPDLRPLVLDRLADDNWNVRSAAVQALASLLPDHPDLRPLVLDRLADDDQYVRSVAVQALASLLPDHPDLRPLVLNRLADDNWNVRRAAVQALASLLPDHPDLRPLVLDRLADDNSNVRRAAVQALASLLPDHPDLRPLVLARLADDDNDVRSVAVQALASLLPDHPDVRQHLLDRLADDNSNVRRAAVEALASLLPNHPDLHPLVLDRLADDDQYMRSAAVQALASLLSDHPDLRPLVLDRLADDSPSVRRAAVQVLASLLPDHSDLRPLVLDRLADDNSNVRRAAVEALASLLPNHPDLRPLVLDRLADDDNDVRSAAVQALAPSVVLDDALAARLLPVVPLLRESETRLDPSQSRRIEALLLQHLGAHIVQVAGARAATIALLTHRDRRLRAAAAHVLTVAGSEALLEALPQLFAALDDRRGLDAWPAHIAAAELLLNNDHYSDRAINIILPALQYGADAILPIRGAAEVRMQAAAALGKLKAAYRRNDVAQRICELLGSEQNLQVLDGLYNALLSLASAPELE